jgi:phage-related holin
MAYIERLLSRIFTSITDNIFIKVAIGIRLYFTGIHIYLEAIGALVLFDVITGITASLKSGQKFTSQELKKGLLEKVALYLILILSAFILEMIFKSMYNWDKFFVVFFVSTLISSYEAVSICENILRINPKLTFLNSLIRLSQRVSKTAIDSADKKIDVIEGENEPSKKLDKDVAN